MKISATIITLNEEANIRAACDSLSWADEIIVVDAGSTDNTRQIAIDSGAMVIENAWPGFGLQKQFANDQTSYDWVFSLDADERVSEELKTAIAELRKLDSVPAEGFFIARRAYYQGKWIKGGGWYPDWQLRFFKKSHAQWKPFDVHESVMMAPGSRTKNLAGDILHYSVRDAAHHHRMIGERYAPLAAQQMFQEGRRTSPLKIATAAPAAFIRSYLLKGGFRDGLAGISIASFAAHHAFLKNIMLWEKQKKES